MGSHCICQVNDLQLPPEEERSPSPEPVYDK